MAISAPEQGLTIEDSFYAFPPGFHNDMFQIFQGKGHRPIILGDWEWTDPKRPLTRSQAHFLATLMTAGHKVPGVLGGEYNPDEIDANARTFMPHWIRKLPGGDWPERGIRIVKNQELLPGGAMDRRISTQGKMKPVLRSAERSNPGNLHFYPDPANSLNYELNKFALPVFKLCLSAIAMTAGPFIGSPPLFWGGLLSSGVLVGTIGAGWMAEANGYGIFGSTKRPGPDGTIAHTFWQKLTESIPSPEYFRDQRNAWALDALSRAEQIKGNILYITSSAHNTQIGETLGQLEGDQRHRALRKLLWHATSMLLPVQEPRLYDNQGSDVWAETGAPNYEAVHPFRACLGGMANDLLGRSNLRAG